MDGKIKWHKPNGPAFNEGEVWLSADRAARKVRIVRVEKFGDGKFDHEVYYRTESGAEYHKDAWNFQVRYFHEADANIKNVKKEK